MREPVYVYTRPEDEAEIARGGEQWIKEIEHTLSLDKANSEGRSLLGSHGQVWQDVQYKNSASRMDDRGRGCQLAARRSAMGLVPF